MPKVLFVTSEAAPLIKTGGLADVSGGLPLALKKLRCSVHLMLPAYPEAVERTDDLKPLCSVHIPGIPGMVKLLQGTLPETKLPVWLVDYEPAFGRKGNPYLHPDGHDWPDNAERFALLAKTAVAVAQGRAGLRWRPEIVHCNDWQTGLVPALLSTEAVHPPTIFTIHNLAYQGIFPASTFQTLGLPAGLWSPDGLEFHEQMSFIKGGLAYADSITTVSPNYAGEILTPQFGCGLEGLLQHRSADLTGILNGVDDTQWDPLHDSHIAQSYNARSFAKKVVNKQLLQQTFGLPENNQALLLGSIGRLVEQKGIDLLLDIIKPLTKLPVQLVLLGSGDSRFEKALQKTARKYADKIAVHIGYDEALAHQIEAGADAFLMPSRFEPCGLNQLYSLRYGTLPIVHAVGGLRDTVTDATEANLSSGAATGFCFSEAKPAAFLEAIERAIALFSQPPQWQKVAQTGMRQSFNWKESARLYSALYQSLLGKSKAT